MARFQQFSPLIYTLIGLAVFFAVFFTVAALGWPGGSDSCFVGGVDICFCERIFPGLVKQPWNTWTNFGFITVGLMILVFVSLDREPGSRPLYANPMTLGGFYPILFGVIVVFMGPGSMFFHGSMTDWGGFLDFFSIMLFAGFAGLYNISRMWLWASSIPIFLAIFLSSMVLLAVLFLVLPVDSIVFYLITAGIAIVSEIFTWTPWNRVKRNVWGSVAFLALFAIALVIWQLSKTDGPLCRPQGFQGHGIWHMTVAMGIAAFYMSLRTEREAS